MATCIDLNQQFGDRYRINRDPAYEHEYGENAQTPDPWYWIIPCKHGHIYPHGGEFLGASTHNRGAIANQLAALPCVQVVQDGADGINAVFHISNIEEVVAILQPKRRRRLSKDHRAKLIAAGTSALTDYRNSKGKFDGRKRDPETGPDPMAA